MKNIPNNVTNIINEFITEINKILGNRVKKIILMQGGDFNKSSDIHIMILTDLTNDEIVKYTFGLSCRM